MKNAPSELLSREKPCTSEMVISIWHFSGSKSILGECMIQKFSRFEYLKIKMLSVNISFCFSMSPCEIFFRKCQPVSGILKGNEEKGGHSYIGSQFGKERS